MRTLVFLATVVGVLAGMSLATHRRLERQRRTAAAPPQPLQTWEGEGGAVPLRSGRTAQQVTPSGASPSLSATTPPTAAGTIPGSSLPPDYPPVPSPS